MTLMPCLLGALVLAAVGGGVVPDPDDLLPQTLDALLAEPGDTLVFNVPTPPEADVLVERELAGTVRALLDVGDLDGDGVSELALGLGPGAFGRRVAVRDGASGAVRWSAPVPGPVRSTRALAHDGERLAIGLTADGDQVQVRALADGALAWSATPVEAPLNVHDVSFAGDLDGDGVADLLVATGAGLDAVLALSGADGTTLWSHAAGDVAYQVEPAALDRGASVLVVGGDDARTGFVRRLSAADGGVLWTRALAGLGATLLERALPEGGTQIVVGQWTAPAPTVRSVLAADGADLWTTNFVTTDVTELVPLGDFTGDGVEEVAVAGFDNAISAVDGAQGFQWWRREGSPVNGGSMLFADAIGDVNANGRQDLVVASLDYHAYVMDGDLGQYLSKHDLRARSLVVETLGGADGPRLGVGAEDLLVVLDDQSGLAAGPVVSIDEPGILAAQTKVVVSAFPGEPILVFGALGAGRAPIGVRDVTLGLDPLTLQMLFAGIQSGTGTTTVLLGPFSREALGVEVFVQALTLYGEGAPSLSPVSVFAVGP